MRTTLKEEQSSRDCKMLDMRKFDVDNLSAIVLPEDCNVVFHKFGGIFTKNKS